MRDIKNHSYSYRAFGLNIASQIPISGFETFRINKADVRIREGRVPDFLPNAVNEGVLYQSTENEFLLRIDYVASYHIRNGNEIIVQREDRSSRGIVSAFIIGTAFGALLHQRKLLPLHACSVLFGNRCLVFAGTCGSGKSTLAAALMNKGGTLIADDISVIDFSGKQLSVRPAFPCIKIWEDSLLHLNMIPDGLEQVRGELKKYYLPVERFNRENTIIDSIFILKGHNCNEVEIRSLQGADKFIVLKKHTYMFRAITKTLLEKNHFMLVNRLASQIPVFTLTRPNSDFDTERLISCITETVSFMQK